MSIFVSILSGCGGGGGGVWTEPVALFSVSATDPANSETGAFLNTKISATFSGTVDTATINTTTFTLKQGTTVVPGTVAFTPVAAVFTPTAILAANTEYTATVTTGAKNSSGKALAADYVWKFTTGTTSDSVKPTVTDTTNGNGATAVPLNTKIGATLSEAMDPTTITTNTFTVKQGTTVVPGTVTFSGVNAVFTPTNNLSPNTVYTATITTGARDLSGNALASDYVWSFTTGAGLDTVKPTVVATVNANNATGVPVNTKAGATFSEALDPLTVNTSTFTLKQGTTPVQGNVTYSGVNAFFTPLANLLPNTLYTATITTGVKDLAGNALASNKEWSWTTGAALDTTAPKVILVVPANLATLVSINSDVRATFDKAMNSTTITNQTFTVKAGLITVAGTVTYDALTKIATFKPTNPLAYNTDYTVTVSNGAKDLAGNALVVPAVGGTVNPWVFKTQLAPIPLPLNPTAPNLGEAGRFVILASQAVTTIGTTAISNGDIGIIDIQRSGITGFTASGPAGDYVELTNGTSYAFDDANPAPFPNPLHFSTPVVGAPWTTTGAMITQVRTDLGIANTFLAADPNPGAPTQVCPIELGNLILTRGVYKTASNVGVTTGPLHFDAQGDPNSIFIISTDGTFTTGATGSIILDNGAQAKNIYIRSAGITTLAAGTTFYGNIFAGTQVNVLSGAHVTGRLFALTDRVTLIAAIVAKAP
jgi:hypothetical protein